MIQVRDTFVSTLLFLFFLFLLFGFSPARAFVPIKHVLKISTPSTYNIPTVETMAGARSKTTESRILMVRMTIANDDDDDNDDDDFDYKSGRW